MEKITTKICKSCSEEKTIDLFRKSGKHADGYFKECKDCLSKRENELYGDKKRKYMAIYRKIKHVKDRMKAYMSKRYKENIVRESLIRKEYKKNHRWINNYSRAKERCENINNNSYKFYGGKGIKFLMTLNDFAFLWTRDKAMLMQHPSIDRIDPDGNYEISNCRYIEASENVKRRRTFKKPVFQILKNGDKILFKSIREASKQFNHIRADAAIAISIKKNRKSYGYKWELA